MKDYVVSWLTTDMFGGGTSAHWSSDPVQLVECHRKQTLLQNNPKKTKKKTTTLQFGNKTLKR